MKRNVLIMAGTAATLATVMVGCSNHDKAAVSVGNAAVAPAAASNTKVIVDGKDQKVTGQVACTKVAGTVNIAIGGGTGAGATGIGAVLTDATPPVVKSVALGNVNGVTLAVGGTTGKADATKDGSSYKITGTATGVDMANPMAGQVNKSFELDVACP
jgi:ipoprotein LpqH